MNNMFLTICFYITNIALVSCIENDPRESSDTDVVTSEPRDACILTLKSSFVEDVSTCMPSATDYQPRTGADTWDTCISDDNIYHRIEESVSSIARVEAYDAIGELLWNNSNVPSARDFLDARDLLDSEEGLGSRLDRRYDVHYPSPLDGASCEDEGVPEQYPQYCVGPGILRPLINGAFAAVQGGAQTQVHTEIIHAALQWFLYVSSIKEGTTCAETAKDCDSSWAYYTGGTPRETPIGLAAEFDEIAPETHDRVYDAVLAIRCWRDLDSAEVATDSVLQNQALAQYDTALLRGMALLIRQRFVAVADCESVVERQAALAGLRVLVSFFDHNIRLKNAAAADTLLQEVKKTYDTVDAAAAIAILDELYSCP